MSKRTSNRRRGAKCTGTKWLDCESAHIADIQGKDEAVFVGVLSTKLGPGYESDDVTRQNRGADLTETPVIILFVLAWPDIVTGVPVRESSFGIQCDVLNVSFPEVHPRIERTAAVEPDIHRPGDDH